MKRVITLALVMTLGACSWVKVTPEGESVRLVQSLEDVKSCDKLGSANTKVMSKFLFNRSTEKVASELADLARNQAVGIGGDTIVPTSEIVDGQRSFGVYKCVKP